MTFAKKYEIYKLFQSKVQELFRKISGNDKSVEEITSYYHFHICPGGSNGGHDKRSIEIFWGNRPYDIIESIGQNLQTTNEVLVEHGSILHYYMLDNGNVLVEIIPAKTKNLRSSEDSIIVDYIKNPECLLKEKYLKKHWKYLKAYMNVTSLWGKNDIQNKLLVFYLRNFKEYSFEKTIQPPKINKPIKDIVKTVLTVGLSGFLLFAITEIRNSNNTREQLEKYNDIITNQAEIIEEILQFNKNLIIMNNTLNNINNNTNDFLNQLREME